MVAVGQVDRDTGVDLQASMSLSFPPTGDLAPAKDGENKNESTVKLPA
jgi:hypothetical protein